MEQSPKRAPDNILASQTGVVVFTFPRGHRLNERLVRHEWLVACYWLGLAGPTCWDFGVRQANPWKMRGKKALVTL